MTRQDLIDRGFNEVSLRKHYGEFGIDAYEPILGVGRWRLELRGGSAAARIRMEVRNLEELDTILLFLARDQLQCRWITPIEQALLDSDPEAQPR